MKKYFTKKTKSKPLSRGRQQAVKQVKQQLSEYYTPRPQPIVAKPAAKTSRVRNFLFSIVVLLVIFLTYFVTRIDGNQVKVVVSSSVFRPQVDYQQAVKKQLSAVKNRSFITIDEQDIATNLQKQFPEVEQVRVESKPFTKNINVKITTSKPQFIVINKRGEFIIDAAGRALTKRQQRTIDVELQAITRLHDDTDFEIELGKSIVSSEEIRFINTVIEQLQRQNITIKQLQLPPVAKQLRLYTNDTAYYTKFYIGGDALQQVGAYLALRQKLLAENILPTQYIDARVEGKLFYL